MQLSKEHHVIVPLGNKEIEFIEAAASDFSMHTYQVIAIYDLVAGFFYEKHRNIFDDIFGQHQLTEKQSSPNKVRAYISKSRFQYLKELATEIEISPTFLLRRNIIVGMRIYLERQALFWDVFHQVMALFSQIKKNGKSLYDYHKEIYELIHVKDV